MSCPKCGGCSGYYDKNLVTFEQHFTWDGEIDDATEPRHVKGGKRKYCIDCQRDVTSAVKEAQ